MLASRALPRPALLRRGKEGALRALLLLCALSALAVVLAVVAIFVHQSLPFFRTVPLSEFLGGTRWAPIHEPASYGILPLIGATLVITATALAVAVPLGFLAALFLAAYAPPRLRTLLKPALEMLAGVPTVVYGFFALRFVTPFLQRFLPVGFWNGLSAGLVMGVMITPYMASLSDDVLYAVPRSLWEAGYALGARRSTVLLRVVVPAASSGIGAAFVLALARAVGETMIVALAAGRTPAWPPNPLRPLLPLTTAMVNIATGDHEAGALIWSHLFAIGLLLFLVTFTLNALSHRVIRRVRGEVPMKGGARALERVVVFGAFLALPLALFTLGVMLVVTALQAGLWANMHALEAGGLVLTARSLNLPDGTTLPYVAAAQVREGSAAAALGIARGDVLVEAGGRSIDRPLSVWSALAALPGRELRLPLRWVPRAEVLLGTLQVRGEVGQARVVLAAPSPHAQAQGLRAGDVLLAVNGNPLTGTRQAGEALIAAARTGSVPAVLTVRRGEETLELPFDPRREGELCVERNPWRAWRAFLTRLGDPRYPEQAGLLPALLGSLGVVLVMAVVAFPLGIAAAVYLEEYARPGRLTSLLELLVASLAGLPSAVLGLLGLEIFARAFQLGRSILAGGLTLAVLVLPLVIITSREALRTVPRTLREAALSVGATPWQVVRHHVLPGALPGVLTGVVLSLSRALGEAAPLLLLGAFLYVNYAPKSLRDTFTVVPIQIFDWATRPQDGYAVVAACAILVLLALVLLLNALAIFLRARFQRRWTE